MHLILHKPISSRRVAAQQFQSPDAHHILYAEDDAMIRNLCAHSLLDSGYRVDLAEDGQKAWEALCRGSYDLLITDHEMPRLNGRDLVKRLRAAGKTLPVILTSGSFCDDEVLRDSSLQLAAALPKPFARGDLLNLIEQILGGPSGVSKQAGWVSRIPRGPLAKASPTRHRGLNE